VALLVPSAHWDILVMVSMAVLMWMSANRPHLHVIEWPSVPTLLEITPVEHVQVDIPEMDTSNVLKSVPHNARTMAIVLHSWAVTVLALDTLEPSVIKTSTSVSNLHHHATH